MSVDFFKTRMTTYSKAKLNESEGKVNIDIVITL